MNSQNYSAIESSVKLLDSSERGSVKQSILEVADITTYSDMSQNGMYMAKQPRFEKATFLSDVSERSNLAVFTVRQAMFELRSLGHLGYTDVHEAFVHIRASISPKGYHEDGINEVFKFLNDKTRQFHHDGSPEAIKEVRDRRLAYEALKAEGKLRQMPPIDRSIGQFIPSRRLKYRQHA